MNTALDIGRTLARQLFASHGNRTEVHLGEADLAAALTLAAERATASTPDATDVTVTAAEWQAAQRVADTLADLLQTLRYSPYTVAHDAETETADARNALDAWFTAHQEADPHCTCPDCCPSHETDVAEALAELDRDDQVARDLADEANDVTTQSPMVQCPTCGGTVMRMADGHLIRHFDLSTNHWCEHANDAPLECGGPDEKD
jgi:hypothetical protein